MTEGALKVPAGSFEGILGLGMPKKNQTPLLYDLSPSQHKTKRSKRTTQHIDEFNMMNDMMKKAMDAFGGAQIQDEPVHFPDSVLEINRPTEKERLKKTNEEEEEEQVDEEDLVQIPSHMVQVPQPVTFLEKADVGRFS